MLKVSRSIRGRPSPVCVSLVTFAVHSLRGLPLELSVVMPALLLFNLLRFPITMMPMQLSAWVSAQLSARRLDTFLQAETLASPPGDTWWPAAPGVVVAGAEFEWVAGRPVLLDLTVQLPRGGLSLIVGAVGAGKSSVLAACLGEMLCTQGKLALQQRLAYVPQQAWVLNDSVRGNILFGSEFDEERYADVVRCCALEEDMRQLHSGDATEVGENGIVISGGQKQRISLARATYAGADILLLDDPLSAVDSHVARHLFEECIVGKLAGTTRVLVTHKLELLPHADHIIVMKEGRVAFEGTYRELLGSGLDLTELLPSDAPAAAPATDRIVRPAGEHTGVASSQQGGKLMAVEERATGSVERKTWLRYFRVAGFARMAAPVALALVAQALKVATSGWVAWWTSEDGAISRALATFIVGYVLWLLASIVLSIARDCMFAVAELRAASTMHNDMLHAVMRAPMAFFDTTPLGRVVARFSKDQNTLDMQLPLALNMLIGCMLEVGFTLVLIGALLPLFLIGLLPIAWVYYVLQRYYAATARELKRLDSISRSPLYAFFAETLAGTESVRAYGRQGAFRRAAEAHVDSINRVQASMFTANRWLGVRVESLGVLIASLAALAAVLGRFMQEASAGAALERYAAVVGLSLSYALSVTNTLGWSVRMIADTETAMNAVERTQFFTELPAEPQTVCDGGGGGGGMRGVDELRDNSVEFRGYSMRYRPSLPLVLLDVSCVFAHNESVGVVGRTGSGKSSLGAALLRLVPAAAGSILIGGVDVAHIPLARLRAMAAVVPQDPVMFAGSLRENLDPADAHSSADIVAALRQVSMASTVLALPQQLDISLSENGSNFSVGERQLLCLCRALLRGSRLVLLDEATSAVDAETDLSTTSMLRTACAGCTLLTIAHRLHTIIEYDRIAVMDAGRLAEIDSPAVLLRREASLFAHLVAATGAEAAAVLTRAAMGAEAAVADRTAWCAHE